MIHIDAAEGDVIEVTVDGTLVHDDYAKVLPEFEEVVHKYGSLRCLIEIDDLDGISPRAVADDLGFDLKHAGQIRRCAVVSDEGWTEWMTRLWGLAMPRCEVRVFPPGERNEAEHWVRAS